MVAIIFLTAGGLTELIITAVSQTGKVTQELSGLLNGLTEILIREIITMSIVSLSAEMIMAIRIHLFASQKSEIMFRKDRHPG